MCQCFLLGEHALQMTREDAHEFCALFGALQREADILQLHRYPAFSQLHCS